jgi:DNA-binding response OmpR family regulator
MMGNGANRIERDPNFRWDADAGVDSILLLDHREDTVGAVESALWMRPHHVHIVATAREAIRICDHFTPNALIVAADNRETGNRQIMANLRKAIPQVPIIALSPHSAAAALCELIVQGADAALYREQAIIPALHNLLGRVRHNHSEVHWPGNFPAPRLRQPWLDSATVGALVCDFSGTVIDVNQRLATWLGYHDCANLIGKVVWKNLLYCAKGWGEWSQVVDRAARFVPGSWTVKGPMGRILTMQIDVFSSAATSKYLQVSLLDQSNGNT